MSPEHTYDGWLNNRIRRRLIKYLVLLTVIAWLIYFSSGDTAISFDNHSKQSLKQQLKNGKLFQVNANAVWRQPFATSEPVSMPRCKVHTYFEPREDRYGEEELLKVWKRAWWAQGFEPVVLTEKDCSSSPKYTAFKNNKHVSKEYKHVNKKWFAWAGTNAGLMVDYHVVPMDVMNDPITLNNLKMCDFNNPVAYSPVGLDMIHANLAHSQVVINGLLKGVKEEDMIDYFRFEEQEMVAYYSDENVKVMLDGQNTLPAQVAELMNAHLHHSFLKRFKKVGIIDPLGTNGRLAAKANAVAETLSQCSAVTYGSQTCPPTTHNIMIMRGLEEEGFPRMMGAKELCKNPCAWESTPVVKQLKTLPKIGSDTYSIATVPHPFSVKALHSEGQSTQIPPEQFEMGSKDEFVQGVTSSILPSSAPIEDRLLLLKDAIFQSSTITNMTWVTLEDDGQDNEISSLYELLEWDLGFALDKPSSKHHSHDDGLDPDARQLVSEHSSESVLASEKYNISDLEIWHFVKSWIQTKRGLVEDYIWRPPSTKSD